MRKLYFVKIFIFVVQVDSKLLSDLVQIKILEKEDNFSIKTHGSVHFVKTTIIGANE
jgi:hypothetical protein